MTLVYLLKQLKELIKNDVASKHKFQKEDINEFDEFTGEYKPKEPEYVNPLVAIITLPHKNFMPQNINYQVPFIVAGMREENDDSDENTVSIQITFGLYGGGYYTDEPGMEYLPDEKTNIDLLNLIEFTKQALVKSSVINGAGTIEQPFKSGIYDTEYTYGYAYGYLSFNVRMPNSSYTLSDHEYDYYDLLEQNL